MYNLKLSTSYVPAQPGEGSRVLGRLTQSTTELQELGRRLW